MAFGGGGRAMSQEAFQARLDTDLNGVSSTLTLLPYKGNSILVNRRTVTVPGAGLTRGVADNLITAAGADSGGAGAANTLYYVYVSNDLATFSPSAIRLSATGPTLVNGVKYLGNAGNALNWRFVGWVRLNGTPKFESSTTNRLIVNYYNRLVTKIGFICPGYVDDGAQTVQTIVSGGAQNWTAVNSGTGSQSSFISNGEDDVLVCLSSWTNFATASQAALLGVALDGSNPTVIAGCPTGILGAVVAASAEDALDPAEGYHTLDMVYAVTGASTFTIVWDTIRLGAAADPKLSGYMALIMA
jgi:hypothetical protein